MDFCKEKLIPTKKFVFSMNLSKLSIHDYQIHAFEKKGVENGIKFWDMQPNEKWQLKKIHHKGFKDMLGWKMKTYGFRVFDFHQNNTQSIKSFSGFDSLISTKYRPYRQGLCLIFKQFWTW